MVTIAVSLIIFLVLLVCGLYVKVPYVAMGQGLTVNTLGALDEDAQDPLPVIGIEGAEVDETTGNLNLTTVSVTDGLSLFSAIGRWMSGDYTLSPRDRVLDPTLTTEELRESSRREMEGSETAATIAALRHLGRPTSLVVADVVPDGPSQDVLQFEDEILSIGGTPVGTTADVLEIMSETDPGTVLPIEIRRGDRTETVEVTVGEHPQRASIGYLGITPTVINVDDDLEITYNVGSIGGPSAGLMLSLALIDKLSEGELTHGLFIAGTGTIDDGGQVGSIGGVVHKTKAAAEAGATVFLVPEGNCAEAAADAPDGLDLVKVTDLDSALDALDAIGDGRPAPSC